jgi:kumamolisin
MQDETNNPSVLSISWSMTETTKTHTEQLMKQVEEALLECAHLGITVCVASGDDGSSNGVKTSGHAYVGYPSSSAYVLCVGGTTIPQKNGTQPDIVWKEGTGINNGGNNGSTGGGVSAVWPRPSWQSDISIASINPGHFAGRIIPDVAANADWTASPYLMVVDGTAQPNGGTSAATPLWASLIALMNAARGNGKQLGYLTPLLYQKKAAGTVGAQGCTDVVSGNNNTAAIGGYSAGPGFDAVSGWGTPNGIKLLAALG